MAGTAIVTGVATLGKLAGGLVNRHANRKAEKMLQQQKQNNRSLFDRAYYEDALQRSENQHALAKTADLLRENYKNSKGRQAIMGGTNDSVTATRNANAQAIANVTGTMASQASSRRDDAQQAYTSQDNAYISQEMANQKAKAKNTAEAVEGLAGTAKNIASIIGTIDLEDAGKDEGKEKGGKEQ